jgi:hypothetical protein
MLNKTDLVYIARGLKAVLEYVLYSILFNGNS